MKFKTIDLCCGIGGIRRGFELASPDFVNVLSADIDPMARKTYQHLFGDEPLSDISTDEFLAQAAALEGGYDVLLAGFPCQAFSLAGKKMGFADAARGTVFFDIARIARETRPKALFLENVENLLRHDRGETFKTIVRILESELGYKVVGVRREVGENDEPVYRYDPADFIRNSKYFGVPQNRPRAYLACFSRERYGDLVDQLPDHLPTRRRRGSIFSCLEDILEQEVDPSYYIASGYLDTLKKHKERQKARGYGFGYVVVNETDYTPHISNAVLATGGSGKERNMVRQHREGVAGTQIPGRETPLNDEGLRFMTPTEWGRLQGFVGYGFMREDGSDGFSFPDGMKRSLQYKQIGNSVTIPAIEEMARYVHAALRFMEYELEHSGVRSEGDVCGNPYREALDYLGKM